MGKARRKQNPGSTSGAPGASLARVCHSVQGELPPTLGQAELAPRSKFLLVSGKLKAKRKEKAHGEGPWF